ncbi:hypothetical protein K2Z83_20435, partial [Oscillochloris sp. ZM17-4]|uniref:hypothetical protein n=1 Tax=Oscillochloris sp. ZM17-4 TaxID=2866714 RepID=UPI001C73737E
MPQFYLAIGSKPRKRDLVVAKLVGQRHILVPLGSAGADLVRADDDLVVVGDSGAWPPGRRDRITLAAYAHEVRG